MNQAKLNDWRDNLDIELRELKYLGVNVPDKAFKLVETAMLDDYLSMDNTEVVDHLIMLAKMEGV
jgi:hypothetical protein